MTHLEKIVVAVNFVFAGNGALAAVLLVYFR